jgi:N-acetylglucosamine malate deacetylase 1
VIRLIRELRPGLVFAPYWKDRHPDHANASRLIIESAFHSGLRKIDTRQEAFRPYRVLFYPSRQDFRPSFIVDVSATHGRKMEAIRAYKSQFAGGQDGNTEPETNISHPGFLEAIAARGRLYGSYIGTAYGEAFLVREPIRIDDPVTLFGPESLMSFV